MTRALPIRFAALCGAAIAGAMLGACSSSHPGTVPPLAVATAQPAAKTRSVAVTLTIPAAPAAAARRTPAYVSASTASVTVTANPGAIVTSVTLSGSICVSVPAGRTCAFSITAPIGNDTFTVVAYDGNNVALSGASNFAATIAEGQSNVTLPLVMGGVPASLDITLAGGVTSTTLAGGASSSTPLTTTVYDADSNIIIGPGAYVDASGTATPIVLTSANASSGFGYTVTPAGSTIPGARSGTITLNEPGDTVDLSYDGSSYVPATDTLTHPAGVPRHTGGGTVSPFSFGWRFTPPFTPVLLLPEYGSSPLAGHQGIVIADGTNRLGFVGDASATCTIPPAFVGSAVTHTGGLTFNAGTTDTNIYAWVSDPTETNGVGLDRIPLLAIISGSCSLAATYAGANSGSTPDGVVAAGNQLTATETVSSLGFVEAFNIASSPLVFQASGLINNSLLSFDVRSVGVSPNGSVAYVQFGDKRFIAEIPWGSTGGSTQNISGSTLDPYPGGTAVDASGNVYANDTTSATFGTPGGIDAFTPSLAAANGTAQLNAPLAESGSIGDLQNLAIGPYAGGNAIYAAATDGIEVFALPTTGSIGTKIAPVETIALPATPVSVVSNNDSREWVLLSDGTLDALPPQ